MIIFNLTCKNCDYEFEGWFDNSIEFTKQNKKKMINCPSCHSFHIKKSLMTPNLNKKTNSKKRSNTRTVVNKIEKYKKIIEKNFDYVGSEFTEEAKKMKYGEIKERPIYGEANIEQTKELIEEEIDAIPLPWTSSKKSN